MCAPSKWKEKESESVTRVRMEQTAMEPSIRALSKGNRARKEIRVAEVIGAGK